MIGVDIYGIPTHVLVVAIAAGFVVAVLGGRFVVIVVIVSIVFISVVIGVVVAITAVIAIVVVAAVPSGVAVIRTAVIHHRGSAVPATVPTAISPGATTTAHHGAYSDSSPEADNGGRGHVAGAVPGNHIRSSINHRRIVYRHID